ncbi:MAG: sigma 54-interacting transcriptional regulator [Deltaproteobacteria bacterium]|nr:sigma 54-interacting transcriptional regulator [Deltaproteobacteria bacterium]
MAHLIFVKEGKPLIQRPCDQTQLIIGRDATCDIQLFEPEISRKHCTIERQNGSFVLKDLSRNGTFLNRKKIEAVKLSSQDEIQIGPWACYFVVEETQAPQETLITEKKTELAKNALGPMLGSTRAMKNVFELLRTAATNDVTICLLGESGTGKELAAKLVHELSTRRTKPFVAINCGAIPPNLIESMLFGHERGSFTGAAERHQGVFEQADGGTLFLDEIGEMPLELQTRLLRVLEERKVRRVGGKSDIAIDIRLVTATLQNLEERVASGDFRHDLFYRLYIFPIALPPLRERPEDVVLLAHYFMETLSLVGKKITLSEAAIQKLKTHNWPGNVRELKNIIQRALLLAKEKTIEPQDLSFTSVQTAQSASAKSNLADQEKFSILDALRQSKGNHSKASRLLGIARSTLASKLRRYKIDSQEWNSF